MYSADSMITAELERVPQLPTESYNLHWCSHTQDIKVPFQNWCTFWWSPKCVTQFQKCTDWQIARNKYVLLCLCNLSLTLSHFGQTSVDLSCPWNTFTITDWLRSRYLCHDSSAISCRIQNNVLTLTTWKKQLKIRNHVLKDMNQELIYGVMTFVNSP